MDRYFIFWHDAACIGEAQCASPEVCYDFSSWFLCLRCVRPSENAISKRGRDQRRHEAQWDCYDSRCPTIHIFYKLIKNELWVYRHFRVTNERLKTGFVVANIQFNGLHYFLFFINTASFLRSASLVATNAIHWQVLSNIRLIQSKC